MNTRVARRSDEVACHRDTRKPSRFLQNQNQTSTARTGKADNGARSSKPKPQSSAIVCKYWINGNCAHGDRCWNLHSWFQGHAVSPFTKLHQHKKIVTGITLPVVSDKLFSSSTDGTVGVWDCHTGQCVKHINRSAEARCLISAGSWVFAGVGNTAKACNIQTAAELTLDGPKGHILSMAVCNDVLFAGAMDGLIYAWSAISEANVPFKPLAMLNGHSGAVLCLEEKSVNIRCKRKIDSSDRRRPGGLFFTGDGTGLLTVWKWLAESELKFAPS
ncbi:zinc finger CCCH domain-containing protein 48-like [Prosopis cineraria]|uniref:zinc finger CCCH domain-containing protein 48-like n=1 Tax=Prosopis cineraria TaxID=364024 RepID=UPI00240F4102|nr:zinc finger CCCH domain-containing protein 48-like [Prosopis cineraria]